MKRKYTIITLLIFVVSIFTSMPAFANTTSSELEEVYDVGGNRIYLNDPEPTEEELQRNAEFDVMAQNIRQAYEAYFLGKITIDELQQIEDENYLVDCKMKLNNKK